MNDGKIRFYDFGEFRVDARRRVLMRSGETISLSPRNFDLLLLLIEHEGQVLSHDDLLDRVWAGTFVEQANLKNAVSVIRRVLGEQANASEFIRTVPRRGYSFVAPVRPLPDVVAYEETETEVIIEEVFETDDEPAPAAPAAQRSLLGKPANTKIRIAAAGLAIVLLSLAAYGVWHWRLSPVRRISAESVKIAKVTTKGTVTGASASPDGGYLLYVTNDKDGTSLWAQQMATSSATRLTPPLPVSIWFFTVAPDNSYVYYTVDGSPDPAQNGLFRVALFGGAPQRIADNGGHFVFAPDGKRIAFSRAVDGRTEFVTADPDRGNEKVVVSFTPDYRIWSMNWTPDSKGLLFALRQYVDEKNVHSVVEYTEETGQAKVIMPRMEKQISSAAWLPDRSALLVCLREVNAEIRQVWQYDPASGELSRVTNDDNSYRSLVVTKDGKSAITMAENQVASIWAADDSFEFRQVTGGGERIGGIGSAGDGRIIYSTTHNSVETVNVVGADGNNPRRLTKGDDGIWLSPKVSADGTSVAYASSHGGGVKQLVSTDFDGRTLVQVTHSPKDVFNGRLLRDNKSVIYQGIGEGNKTTIFRQDADGTVAVLTNESSGPWDVSPDEKFLAYVADDGATHQSKVFVKSIESGWNFRTFDIEPATVLRWTRDGKGISFDTRDGDTSEIHVQPLDEAAPRLLSKFSGDQIFAFDWSFDGRKLYAVRGRRLGDAVQISLAE